MDVLKGKGASGKCSGENGALRRLFCYDNLPENLKNSECSSISDNFERLSCFQN